MNKELIHQLAEKAAGTRKHVPAVWQFYDEELEAFVRLIVRECARLCNNFDVYYADNSPLKREVALETAHDLADMILEHFEIV